MSKKKDYFIIDFDSTFIQLESLEELARLALAEDPNIQSTMQKLAEITNQGMDGTLDYGESLKRRFACFTADRALLQKLIEYLRVHITPSIERNKAFFQQYTDHIYIISGGFKEIIMPIVEDYGIDPSHVFANELIFDQDGRILGVDEANPCAHNGGKTVNLKNLNLDGKIHVIGDGSTDYEMKKQGAADHFYLFTENITRSAILDKADYVIKSFDELLFHLKLPRAQSFPKSKIKVLILENIHQKAVQRFREEGYNVEEIPQALAEKELIKKIQDVSVVCIRSQTKLTKHVLDNAPRLHTVGAFCIGTNQIDLHTATEKGITVFNAPYSNTRSVVELAIGEIIMLMRKTGKLSSDLHTGIWNKSAKGSHEIRGKTLGIIGYGNIGSQLSVLAENMGMEVLFYDTGEKLALGNARKCTTMDEVLRSADIISLHVDGKKQNHNLIGKNEFAKMKQGAVFLNLSRGFVVDIDALKNGLESGHITGAAVDVFPQEPSGNTDDFTSPLQGLANVILTPHVGGSTEEAQQDIGEFVSKRIVQFMNTGDTTLSVNFPNLQLPELQNSSRLIHIHTNVPGILAQINKIFADEQLNIEGQYLKTNEQIGYVITDNGKKPTKEVLEKLRAIEATIRVRVLY